MKLSKVNGKKLKLVNECHNQSLLEAVQS